MFALTLVPSATLSAWAVPSNPTPRAVPFTETFGVGNFSALPSGFQGWNGLDGAAFAAVQLARLTGDRTRDLEADLRARTVAALKAAKSPERWLQVLTQVVALEAEDEARALGDTLPIGLKF
jgi:hypothetical protein